MLIYSILYKAIHAWNLVILLVQSVVTFNTHKLGTSLFTM